MSLVDIRYTPDHALSVTVPNRNSWNFQSVFISNMVLVRSDVLAPALLSALGGAAPGDPDIIDVTPESE